MSSAASRFKVGDAVTVLIDVDGGNPRTPGYVRGKSGIVTFLHGAMANPIDHRHVYPPLYTVTFRIKDVFGGAASDTLSVDIHEEWLRPT